MNVADVKRGAKRQVKGLINSVFGKSANEIASMLPNDQTVISFDVFDTLVLRDCPKPEDAFDLAQEIFNDTHWDMPVLDFKKRRIVAECNARKYLPSEEVTVYEIYAMLDDELRDISHELLKCEIEAEFALCYANPDARLLYDEAIERGHRVVIASDMYLPRYVIADILDRCGYDGYWALYVSSDAGLTKRCGSLFKYICRDLDINKASLIHIGDNPITDFMSPRQLGIVAHLYSNKGRKE